MASEVVDEIQRKIDSELENYIFYKLIPILNYSKFNDPETFIKMSLALKGSQITIHYFNLIVGNLSDGDRLILQKIQLDDNDYKSNQLTEPAEFDSIDLHNQDIQEENSPKKEWDSTINMRHFNNH
jgi:hypothetical protein